MERTDTIQVNHAIEYTVAFLVLAAPNAARMPVAIQDSTADSCVVSKREGTAEDVLVRERKPILGAPTNANDAPGPGAFRAVVRTGGHPAILVVDKLAGTSRFLCSGSTPRFSPNGRWIACIRWSRERPYMLAIVEVRTGKVRTIDNTRQIEDYAWSPNSQRLAFTSGQDIGWIDIASGKVQVLATDHAEHGADWDGLEWAPDGRRFLGRRHLEYEHDDSVYATDLWLFEVGGKPRRLTHTPKVDEDAPGWLDDRRIRYEVSESSDDEVLQSHRYVIELAAAGKERAR